MSSDMGPGDGENRPEFDDVRALRLLDLVDRLKGDRVGDLIHLPRLIVCGDQSAGKSSVLEAISRQKFPTNDLLCTRYPHELDMRPGPQEQITITIVPATDRAEADQQRLRMFHLTPANLDGLPAVVQEAGRLMGLGRRGGPTFGNDVLRIAMTGPRLPPLTVVDLPGLFHSGVDGQTNDDAEFVKDLVRRYMGAPRTIILAVVSAKNDPVNQIVLRYAHDADRAGERTLGIITKPDMTDSPGLANHILRMARNEVRALGLGWHVLKNRSYADRDRSNGERDRSEAEFFSQGVWAHLSDELKGIKSLQFRLSGIYHETFVRSLPELRRDVEQAIDDQRTRLRELDAPTSPRTTIDAHKALYHASLEFTRSVTEALQKRPPHHRHGTDGVAVGLRNTAQGLVHAFRQRLRREGHAYELVEDSITPDQHHRPPQIRHRDLVEEVGRKVADAAGIPYEFDPDLVSELFYDRSRAWPDIIHGFIDEVLDAVERCLRSTVQTAIKPELRDGIFNVILNPALNVWRDRLQELAGEKTARHVARDTIDFDQAITDLILPARMAEDRRSTVLGISKHFLLDGEGSGRRSRTIVTNTDVDSLADSIMDMWNVNRTSGAAAIRCMLAYYETELQRLQYHFDIDNLDRWLLQGLPTVFVPETVGSLTTAQIQEIVGEDQSVKAEREDTTVKLQALSRGLQHLINFEVEETSGTTGVKRPAEDVWDEEMDRSRPTKSTKAS